MNELHNKYKRLDKVSQSLLQLLAFLRGDSSYHELARQAGIFGLRQSNGRALTQASVRESLRAWTKSGLLSQSSARPAPELMDTLVRDGVAGDDSQRLLSLVKNNVRWARSNTVLDFYIAFYDRDTDAWNIARRGIADGCLPLLSPFCDKTFERLPAEMQSGFFSFLIPAWIVQGQADPNALQAFRQRLDDEAPYSADLLPRILEWALASGDRKLLERLRLQTAGKMQDVEGCWRLLSRDFSGSFALLSETLSNRTKARVLTKVGGLPSLIAMIGALAGDASVSREQAFNATMTVLKSGNTPYNDAFAVAQQGLVFMKSPGNVGKLIADVNALARSPLAKWTAGYVQTWLAADAGVNSQVGGLTDAAKQFSASGCCWLAAETHAAASRSKLKTADKQQKLSEQIHRTCGTASLLDCVQPEPVWSRTLNAIALLGGQNKTTTPTDTRAEPMERLIFEIFHNQYDFQLDVYHQLRKGSQWSKGRKIALSRLFHQHAEPDFAFLTPEDRALCQTLRHWTERNSYGYPEEHTHFETSAGARALIGHPRIFRPNQREQPLEIIEKPLALVVRQLDDTQIELFLDPRPVGSHVVRFEESSPYQVAITLFETSHQMLQSMLGKSLSVPASASAKVLETITQLTSVVTIHSEIGDLSRGQNGKPNAAASAEITTTLTPAKTIVGDSSSHLHLLPSGDGLRAELYVQPFVATGPVCRPGEGGTTLFATIEGLVTSATRDLSLEVQLAQALLAQCDALSSHLVQSWTATFSSPTEALELLLDLEPLAQSENVTAALAQRSITAIGGCGQRIDDAASNQSRPKLVCRFG
jgi:hypothetical protein